MASVTLHFKSFGQGDPLLILHGLFGTADNWQTLGKRFSEENLVYLLDQRNHGRSPHAESLTYSDMAEDLHLFMESHWIYKTHLLGHSMGGKTAMQFALQYPDKVEKLIVVDMAPKAYSGGHESIFEALFTLQPRQMENRKEADQVLAGFIPDQGIRLFLLKNLTRDTDGSYRWKMNLPTIYEHYSEILAALEGDTPFEGPALFIRGERSGYIRDADWPAIVKLFPHAELATVQHAGHWVHAEAPDDLFALVRNFLDR